MLEKFTLIRRVRTLIVQPQVRYAINRNTADKMTTSKQPVEVQEADTLSTYSETAPPSYTRRAPKLSPVQTAAFAFSCLGVIYSDIGTSPLYVLSTIFPSDNGAPSKDDVIGIISAIIWSFTLLPLLKYVSIPLGVSPRLQADPHGPRLSVPCHSDQQKGREALSPYSSRYSPAEVPRRMRMTIANSPNLIPRMSRFLSRANWTRRHGLRRLGGPCSSGYVMESYPLS